MPIVPTLMRCVDCGAYEAFERFSTAHKMMCAHCGIPTLHAVAKTSKPVKTTEWTATTRLTTQKPPQQPARRLNLAMIPVILFWIVLGIVVWVVLSSIVVNEVTKRPLEPQNAVMRDDWTPPDPCTLSVVSCGKERVVTAYTSHEDKTDATPEIAADGTNIYQRYLTGEQTCASNAYPFGTRLFVEELGVCTVADRMARKNDGKLDWYFGKDLNSALSFGVKTLEVHEL